MTTCGPTRRDDASRTRTSAASNSRNLAEFREPSLFRKSRITHITATDTTTTITTIIGIIGDITKAIIVRKNKAAAEIQGLPLAAFNATAA